MSPTPLIVASLILSANKYKKKPRRKYNVPHPSHRSFADPYGVVNDMQRKPREMSQFGKKSAKEYHSLYSSTEQLQVAL
jgi:hypothetical protein